MPLLALETSGWEWILLAIGGVITLGLGVLIFIIVRKERGKG